MSDHDPNLGIPPSPEELEAAREKLCKVKLEEVNQALYEVLRKTDFVHFSEFISGKKKKAILLSRGRIKKEAEEIEEMLKGFSFNELAAFNVRQHFKEQGWL